MRKQPDHLSPAPDAHTPGKLPDPWLVDSEYLLAEITRIRGLVLQIPLTLESYAPSNTVVDALWRLEQQLRFLLHLHREAQRTFALKGAVRIPAARSDAHGEGVSAPEPRWQSHGPA